MILGGMEPRTFAKAVFAVAFVVLCCVATLEYLIYGPEILNADFYEVMAFNEKGLPSRSSFGTRKFHKICTGADKALCVDPLLEMEWRIALGVCLIHKNLSTLLKKIMCMLNQQDPADGSNPHLLWNRNFSGCEVAQNGLPGAEAVQKIKERSWKFVAVVRDPIERFLSGFIDRCVARRRCEGSECDVYCYGCGTNMTCFIEAQYDRLMEISRTGYRNQGAVAETFLEAHFYPQSWRCSFGRHLISYEIVKYGSNMSYEFETILAQHGLAQPMLQLVTKQLKSRSKHATSHLYIRRQLEYRIRTSPYLMEYLIRMYYYDFKIFGFPIPKINYGMVW